MTGKDSINNLINLRFMYLMIRKNRKIKSKLLIRVVVII